MAPVCLFVVKTSTPQGASIEQGWYDLRLEAQGLESFVQKVNEVRKDHVLTANAVPHTSNRISNTGRGDCGQLRARVPQESGPASCVQPDVLSAHHDAAGTGPLS